MKRSFSIYTRFVVTSQKHAAWVFARKESKTISFRSFRSLRGVFVAEEMACQVAQRRENHGATFAHCHVILYDFICKHETFHYCCPVSLKRPNDTERNACSERREIRLYKVRLLDEILFNVTDRSDQPALLREQEPINRENRWNVRWFAKAYVHSESHGT